MGHPDVRGLEQWQLLGRSPHAVVWRARQPALDRSVAVKVYAAAVDAPVQQEFLRVTARAARLAGHPGIGSLHDAGVLPDGRPYVVEELAAGGPVAGWLEGPERPGAERVRQVGAVVADALATAHAAGVVHGSVSPTNVLIDGFGAPVLVDFGAALVHAGAPDAEAGGSGQPVPLDAAGGAAPTPADDVRALAAMLSLLLGGPPGPASRPARPRGPQRGAHPPLRGVDPALRALLLRCLSADPAARPSAAELRDGLRRRPSPSPPAPARRAVVPATAPSSAGSSSGSADGPRRRAGVLAGVAALALLGSGAWLAATAASSGPPAIPATTSTTAATPVDSPASGGATPAEPVRLALEAPSGAAEPFEAVRIRGTFSGGPRSTFLRVQRWERGAWRAFPVPTRADRTGRFSTHVELGQPGRYPLRVLDPTSGVASEPVLLVVVDEA